MKFKAKLSKQGNGYCIYVPVEVRTELDLNEEYEWEVYTGERVITMPRNEELPLIKEKFNAEWCSKHNSYKGTCGCK